MTNNFKQETKTNLSCRTRSGIQGFKASGFRLGGRHDKRSSFTLIELLVTLAIVAVLSVVVVFTLNPAELLKQARDSDRLSDLATINTALNLFSTDVTSGFMGTSTVVYTSLVNTVNPATTTCAGMGLPALPSGWTYNCPTSTQSLRNTDGTGWIPVNFNRISSNSPISQLPIDPQNTTTTKYYTYVTGGSWQLTSMMESQKYQATTYTSGGADPSTYTIGNNLTLAPFIGGLIGWWNFEEGAGATSTDYSGFNKNGSWHGTSTESQRYVSGRVGAYAGSFNGINDYIDTSASMSVVANTVSFWIYLNSSAPGQSQGGQGIIWSAKTDKPAILLTEKAGMLYTYNYNRTGNVNHNIGYPGTCPVESTNYSCVGQLSVGRWTHVSVTHEGTTETAYIDGVLVKTKPYTPLPGYTGSFSMSWTLWAPSVLPFLNGKLDDIRIYNRALSAAEIQALYNGTK